MGPRGGARSLVAAGGKSISSDVRSRFDCARTSSHVSLATAATNHCSSLLLLRTRHSVLLLAGLRPRICLSEPWNTPSVFCNGGRGATQHAQVRFLAWARELQAALASRTRNHISSSAAPLGGVKP